MTENVQKPFTRERKIFAIVSIIGFILIVAGPASVISHFDGGKTDFYVNIMGGLAFGFFCFGAPLWISLDYKGKIWIYDRIVIMKLWGAGLVFAAVFSIAAWIVHHPI